MTNLVHKFDNGIKVYQYHLLELQKERYEAHNVHEAEEEGVFIEALSSIKNGGTYVNVGAAIGYYPLLAASIRDDLRIVAYEPLRVHRKYFHDNIKLNGFRKSDFKMYKEGVYKMNGTVNFKVEDYGSMIREDKRKKSFFKKIKEIFTNDRVSCVSLRKLSDRETNKIDLLQMDIQGIELSVLESAEDILLGHTIKRFLIGTHSEDIHQCCKNVLIKNGYHILHDMYETKLQPDGIILAECELE